MKILVARVAIVFLWLALCSADNTQQTSMRSSPYFPRSCFIIEREGYVLSYDGRTRNAGWVYERLTRDSFEIKNADRSKLKYKVDELVPECIQSSPKDYQGSGFDFGHLCPFGDCRSHPTAASETFILSNISPQVPEMNRGFWRKLEEHLRDLALEYSVLHVITIPLYLPQEGYVRYQTIGPDQVAVPTHFCKVVFIEKIKGVDVIAYILPNAKIPKESTLEQFRTTLKQVERLSGVIFPGFRE
ncbi:MAG: non-specific endonuclease [Parachlamydiales bacterium]|nr:non-specific endonuclease [Parachlamydiales bacterium]